jgi:hypothetical protein
MAASKDAPRRGGGLLEAPCEAGTTRHGNRMGIARESFGNNDILGCVWELGFWDQLGTLAFWELHGNDDETLLGLAIFGTC